MHTTTTTEGEGGSKVRGLTGPEEPLCSQKYLAQWWSTTIGDGQ